MKYKTLFSMLISFGILLSFLSCMKRSPVKIYDESIISSAEAARISIPADIKVERVDGNRFGSLTDYVLSTIEEFHVAPGEHEIVVRYSTNWTYGKRKHEEIKSENIALKFNAESGALYTLTHPELNDMMEAKKFAENPDIRIEKTGIFADLESEVSRVSSSDKISESMSYAEPEKSSPMKGDTSLKEEWYGLSEEEKEEFRKWLEWKNMSEEEKEKFREWKSKSDKE